MSAPVQVGELVAPVLRDLARDPAAFGRWMRQVQSLGGCTQPVRLAGETLTMDRGTGEVLHRYDTAHEPHGHLLVRCKNRRASRCPACAETYRADTFQLIRAGLAGGKGVPETVREHTRVFATFTAPSFGPVHAHRVGKNGKALPCHPRRDGGSCPHGVPVSCTVRHDSADPACGQPICPDCYDYTGAVLWNAHAGVLWRRFTIYLRRTLARLLGLTVREFRERARVSYAKVAEFQRRGLVHFHAVIRIDGPDGPDSPPQVDVSVEALEEAIRAAAAAVYVISPATEDVPPHELGWGDQLDVRSITALGHGELTEQAVAGYIAKYATKSAETTGTVDRPIKAHTVIGTLDVPEHARRMIATCWRLGRAPELAELRLSAWAHMLGFRGHFCTKARAYSTTYGAIRSARAELRAEETRERLGLPEAETTLVLAHWRYAGHGFTPGESILAAAVTKPDPAARRPKTGTEGEST
jgi:hypothetical protein